MAMRDFGGAMLEVDEDGFIQDPGQRFVCLWSGDG